MIKLGWIGIGWVVTVVLVLAAVIAGVTFFEIVRPRTEKFSWVVLHYQVRIDRVIARAAANKIRVERLPANDASRAKMLEEIQANMRDSQTVKRTLKLLGDEVALLEAQRDRAHAEQIAERHAPDWPDQRGRSTPAERDRQAKERIDKLIGLTKQVREMAPSVRVLEEEVSAIKIILDAKERQKPPGVARGAVRRSLERVGHIGGNNPVAQRVAQRLQRQQQDSALLPAES